MLLRIIDDLTLGVDKKKIRIILQSDEVENTFLIESYNTPITDNFSKNLSWYFKDYPQNFNSDIDDSGVAEKLIKFGQYIGDELLGEDHQLIKIKEVIEKYGYENLHVQIESGRVDFFKEQWEYTILPESKYVLSSVAKEYKRKFTENIVGRDYTELCYELHSVPPKQKKIEKFLNDNTGSISKIDHGVQNPLRILHVISRPNEINLPFRSSNGINQNLDAIATGGSIEYDVQYNIDWHQLLNKLTDKKRPVHIFQYDGPIIIKSGSASIFLASTNEISSLIGIDKLSSALVSNKVGALSIDPRTYLNNGELFSALEGLAIIAQTANKHGLGNVIGLGQITNPWISGQCFEAVYLKILKGFSLGQAVVEARKTLQSNITTSFATMTSKPFHTWSLLIHYSNQEVNFFRSSPAPSTDNDSQRSELFREILFGFRPEMLPPVLNQISDGQALDLIAQLANAQDSNRTVVITGEAGSGKSHLAHIVSLFLAENKRIDFGFYFGFSQYQYSATDMLEMIAPILDINASEESSIFERLSQVHCCFVFDDFSRLNPKENNSGLELDTDASSFIRKLISYGHVVMVITEAPSEFSESALINLMTTPLPVFEQTILATNTLRNLLEYKKLEEDFDYKDFHALLATLDGNPWLIKKIMPLIISDPECSVKNQVNQYINSNINEESKVHLFYKWQWTLLNPVWQRLLILCSDTRGLLLEMLMAAFDQKQDFTAGKALLDLLGKEDGMFLDGLNLWDIGGFLHRLPHGRIVDPRCLAFLETQRDACFRGVDQIKAQLHFSQIVCEGIRLLARHVLDKPNPTILNYLLFNRQYWVKHFESLWFSQDCRGFIAVKNAFDPLLQQAKLEEEGRAWTLNLLERSSITTVIDESTIDVSLCWLTLASSVLNLPIAKDSKAILLGEKFWRAWFDMLSDSFVKQQQLVLVQQVVVFLEKFYNAHSDWLNCLVVCKKACAIYREYEAWPRVIKSLMSLSQYTLKLGDNDQAIEFENSIIYDIPYADAPPGLQSGTMLDILLARVARSDTLNAQIILDQIRNSESSEKLTEILDGFQCDIYFEQGNYLAALPHYCKIWVRALQSNHQVHIEKIRSRMLLLEKNIGYEYFNQIFDKEAPEGTAKPSEYINPIH